MTRTPRTRETAVIVRVDGRPNVVREGAPSVGVWSLCHCADDDGWCIVHRPTGLTLWYMRCVRFGLGLLDELGHALPDYGARLPMGTMPDPLTDDAKRSRDIVFSMEGAWADVEDAYWSQGELL